jgi:hypothetical protein
MSILKGRPCASTLSFDADHMWVTLTDGRVLGVPLAYFPTLMNASVTARSNYEVSGGGTGIHWDALDEDISVEHLLLGFGDRTTVRNAS